MPSLVNRRLSTVLTTTLLAGGIATAASPPASAATGGALLYGLTSANHLVSFRQAAAGTALTDVTITGLAASESVVGIDIRPATSDVLALGSTGRLYTVNPATGAATATTGTSAPTLNGTSFGVDVNPVPDRVRVVSDADQDLRLNPVTGDLAATDGTLAYAAGDTHAGANPTIVAAAYTNSVAGATATTLYDIDSALDALVIQNPPNSGTLNTVGSLGVDTSSVAGLDIDAATGTAFAVLTVAGTPSLYTINLTTGAATLLGSTVSTLTDLTVATPRLRVDAQTVVEGLTSPVTVTRTGDVADPATVDYATTAGTATADADYTTAAGTLTFAAGAATASFPLQVKPDFLTEGPETLVVTLSNPSAGVVLSPAAGTVTITEPAQAYALTTDNKIATFALSAPGTFTSTVAVTGITDDLVGIDVRPSTGALLALGSAGRLYTVDPVSGAATQVGSNGAFTLNGANFGFDVNPVPDRVRVVSDADQNLRLNPNDGTLAVTDGTLAYAAGDTFAGENPAIFAAGYTNSVAGATTTTLYDIDADRNALVIQNPPNSGTLNTVGALGLDVTGVGDLDIAPAGNTAFAALTPSAGVPTLYRLNLTTGAATSLGAFATTTVEDLALPSPGRLGFAATTASVGEGAGSVQLTVSRTQGTSGPVSVDYTTASGSATAGQDFTTTAGTLVLADGQTTGTITVPVLQDLSPEGPESFTVTLSNPAGAATLGTATSTVTIADDESAGAFGLTTDNRITTFSATSPATAPTSNVAVTGLASGEDLLGIDVRPATGLLYGISNLGKIYAISPVTGDTQLVSTSSVVPSGTAFGVDVNPVADRLRVVSSTGQNLRIDIDTGVATTDTALAYPAADSGGGQAPAVAAAGYTNSAVGSTTTALYDIDTTRDVLVLQNPPNDGTLTTVGPLGVDASAVAGLDIGTGSSAFAVLTVAGAPSVYRIDLTTGHATSLGALATTTVEDLAFSQALPVKAGRLHPLPPTRLYDSRTPKQTITQGTDQTVVVAGKAGVPSTGASAVILNITVTGSSNRGYVTVYPTGSKPTIPVSNITFEKGQTLSVEVQTGLGTGGSINLSSGAGSVDVVVDVLGWYGDGTDASGVGYQPLTPKLVLDTRKSTPLTAGADQLLQLGGVAGVPSGSSAVALNVTLTGSSGTLDVELFPNGSPPAVKTTAIVAVRTQTVANANVVKLGADGKVALRVHSGRVNVLVTVVGYYGDTAAGRFVAVAPKLILDTRKTGGRLSPGVERVLAVGGANDVPATAVGAVLSITGTEPAGRLYVEAFATGRPPAAPTSLLNLEPRHNVTNLVVTPLGTGGATSLRIGSYSTHLVVSQLGYVLPS